MSTFRKLLAIAVLGLSGVLLLAGCGGATPNPSTGAVNVKQDPAWLESSNWVATQIRDSSGALVPVVSGSRVTAIFKASEVTGNASINRYRGTFATSADDAITFTLGPSTLMGGPEPLMTQETNYLAALTDTRTYRVTAEKLELFDESGKPTVAFAASKPAALVGPTWYCNGYNNGKEAIVSLEASSEITIMFSEDGKVSGSGGVNTYGTTYTTTGSAMTIDPEIATTLMAGPENLMAQEQAYLAALPKTTRYELQDEELILWNQDARIASYKLTPLE
jgi:heat shock protein HslJ